MNVNLIYVKGKSTFTNEKGEVINNYNLALQLPNGVRIVIKPVFKDDLKILKALADKVC